MKAERRATDEGHNQGANRRPTSIRNRIERVMFVEASQWLALAAAVVVGVGTAVHAFGVGYVTGTSDFWTYPVGDAETMLTGWNYYVHDAWHWPLAHTNMSCAPTGLNILYLDAIPLVSLVSKALRTVLGVSTIPFGPWHLTLYVLQCVFAVCIARRLGLRDLASALGVALLCVSMHVFVGRFYHEGLNGHFVILWSILLYLRGPVVRSTVRFALECAACLSIAALHHPYLFMMCLPAFGAAVVRRGRVDWRQGVGLGASATSLVILVLFMFGHLPSKLPPDPGYFGLASMNLLSLVIPFQSSLLPWLPSPSIQEATGAQWDGHNFLGVGVLALLLTGLTAGRGHVFKLLQSHGWYAALLLPYALYAPSNRWFFGTRLFLEYEVPGSIMPLAVNFRATGRFFWPVAYALVIFVSAVVARSFRPKWGPLILLAAGLLQLVDSNARAQLVRECVAHSWQRELDWPAWTQGIASVDVVDLYPSFDCITPIEPPAKALSVHLQQREIEFMAARAGKRTNAARAGRRVTDCAVEAQAVRTLLDTRVAAPGHLVVIIKDAFGPADVAALRAHLVCEDTAETLRCRNRGP